MIHLRQLPYPLAICKIPLSEEAWTHITPAPFWSVTRTAEELSVVLPPEYAQPTWTVEGGWRAFGVVGPLDFELVGILAALAQPLAKAGIPIFVISTYDTDYLLVRETQMEAATAVLEQAGHTVQERG